MRSSRCNNRTNGKKKNRYVHMTPLQLNSPLFHIVISTRPSIFPYEIIVKFIMKPSVLILWNWGLKKSESILDRE